MSRTALKTSVSAVFLTFALSAPAFAEVDAAAFSAALTAHAKLMGLNISAEKAEADGDDIILTNVTVQPGELNPAKIPGLTLKDVTEEADAYRIGLIEAPEIHMEKEGKKLDFAGGSVTGIWVAKPDATDPIRKAGMLVEGMEAGALSASENGAVLFKMDDATYKGSPYEPGKVMATELKINGMEVDTTRLPDPKSRAIMQQLGYSLIKGGMTMAGEWDPQGGRMNMSEWTLDVNDAAALTMSLDLSGMTAELLASISELQRKKDAGEIDDQAMGMSMLGVLSQLSFNGAQVRLLDASLTGKVLDFVAAQQGAKRGDVVNMAKGMMPMMLAQLQNPEFAQMVTAAVSQYLDDPKSLTITAAPPAPVPAPQIMAAGMSAPQSIPNVLAVKVTAND